MNQHFVFDFPTRLSVYYTIDFLISLAGNIRDSLFQVETSWDLYYHCI